MVFVDMTKIKIFTKSLCWCKAPYERSKSSCPQTSKTHSIQNVKI